MKPDEPYKIPFNKTDVCIDYLFLELLKEKLVDKESLPKLQTYFFTIEQIILSSLLMDTDKLEENQFLIELCEYIKMRQAEIYKRIGDSGLDNDSQEDAEIDNLINEAKEIDLDDTVND